MQIVESATLEDENVAYCPVRRICGHPECDPGFSTRSSSDQVDGLVTTDFAPSSDYAYSVALQSDGRIVVAGGTNSGYPTYHNDFGLARYDAEGSLDSRFGSGGLVTTDFAGSCDGAYAVAIQTDGKIVLAGGSNSGPPTGDNLALARHEGVTDPDRSH